jgi:hypothetical protein
VILALGLWTFRSHAEVEENIRQSVARAQAAHATARWRAQMQERQQLQAQQVSAANGSTGNPPTSPRLSTPAERAAQDSWVRQQAEARLRAEQARFAQLTGQGQVIWQPGISNPTPSNQSRCARAKADRDAAYAVAGNQRSFEFIRRWDEVVYEACKGT